MIGAGTVLIAIGVALFIVALYAGYLLGRAAAERDQLQAIGRRYDIGPAQRRRS